MIPPNLDAFRKLMEAAAEVCDMNGYPDHLIAPDLHALATATPEQLLEIVGHVEVMRHAFEPRDLEPVRSYLVTPATPTHQPTKGQTP